MALINDGLPKQQGRRLLAFWVDPWFIAALCIRGERHFCVDSCVPDTARFFRAWFEPSRNAFAVVFEDDSFELITPGALIPFCISPEVTHVSDRSIGND